MKTLKVLDLFSGLGTFSYALDQIEHNGKKVFETVAFCEFDKDCYRVLDKHWPNTPIFSDIRNLKVIDGYFHDENGKTEWEADIDVIVGGFPCTDISVAGKQKGLVDENGQTTRSGLWSHYKRLIQEIRPRYVLIENVRNLLSNGIGTVLKDLSEIRFDAEWEVISARDVGQCHLRERLWIVAYPNGESVRDESRRLFRSLGTSEGESGDNGEDGEVGDIDEGSSERHERAHLHDFRFWPSFATEEEKSKWWAEATVEFRDWRKAQPEFFGIYDGPTSRLHEKFRRGRIKQLGNGIVRSIAQLHGERIKYHETNELGAL